MPPASEIAVSIVELEAVRVATVRSIVDPEDVPAFMADALGVIVIALHEAGLRPAGPPFARYFSMSPEGLDVATGFPIAEPFFGAEVVHAGALPAGPAAVTTYVGPFEGLEAAWTAFRARIDELGRRRSADPWEVYVVGPGSGVDEAEWRTELVWPLEPLGAPSSTGSRS
jgi:effector-binding domain-containing protein